MRFVTVELRPVPICQMLLKSRWFQRLVSCTIPYWKVFLGDCQGYWWDIAENRWLFHRKTAQDFIKLGNIFWEKNMGKNSFQMCSSPYHAIHIIDNFFSSSLHMSIFQTLWWVQGKRMACVHILCSWTICWTHCSLLGLDFGFLLIFLKSSFVSRKLYLLCSGDLFLYRLPVV